MSGWIIYATIALSISLTSYINIYVPSLNLYREITEEESPAIGSIVYKILWVVLAFIIAPIIGLMLLSGGNENKIRKLALMWVDSDNE